GKRIASVLQMRRALPASERAKVKGELKLWDAATGKELLTLPGCYGVAFSPDGRRVASACADRTVKVWDAETGRQEFSLSGHQNAVLNVAWSGDGRLLASTSLDFAQVKVNAEPPGEVKLWDAIEGKE